jgi:hypothetical protein
MRRQVMPIDVVEQGPEHRRHASPEVHLLTHHRLDDGRGLETRQQHDRRASQQARVHQDRLPVGMEQRQRREQRIARAGTHVDERQLQVTRQRRVDHHVGVREFGPLGLPRRARRVEHHGRLVGARRMNGAHRALPAITEASVSALVRWPALRVMTVRCRIGHRLDGELRERQFGRAFEHEQARGVAAFEVIGDLARASAR